MKKVTVVALMALFMFAPCLSGSVKADDAAPAVTNDVTGTGTVVQVIQLGPISLYLIQDQDTGLVYSIENVGLNLNLGDMVTYTKPANGRKIIIGAIIRK